MIIVNNEFIFLNNPRTGSRAFTLGLIAAGAVPEGTKHVHTMPIEIASSKYVTWPKYTILRDPVDWALSYWGMSGIKSFDEWIEQPLKVLPWAENRLNAYSGIATHYMLYEWGHESMFRYLGIDPPSIPLVGSLKERRGSLNLTFKRIERIYDKFEADVKEYTYIKRTAIRPKYIPPDKNRKVIQSIIASAEMK